MTFSFTSWMLGGGLFAAGIVFGFAMNVKGFRRAKILRFTGVLGLFLSFAIVLLTQDWNVVTLPILSFFVGTGLGLLCALNERPQQPGTVIRVELDPASPPSHDVTYVTEERVIQPNGSCLLDLRGV